MTPKVTMMCCLVLAVCICYSFAYPRDKRECPFPGGVGGLRCLYGPKTDSNGCEGCLGEGSAICPGVSCLTLTCEFGYSFGTDGCYICQCNPPICAVPWCSTPCRYGVLKNKDGCETCECKPEP